MKTINKTPGIQAKLILTSFFVLSMCFSTFAQEKTEAKGVTLTVIIDNFTNNQGKAVFSLHTQETFMRGQGIQNLESTIEDGKAQVVFENVEAGTYAILALHDANENGRMDFEANGMPKESYGTSNNEMSFGPPQFIDAKFQVTDVNKTINIRL